MNALRNSVMNRSKMSSKPVRKTPIKSPVIKTETSVEMVDYSLHPSETPTTQISSRGKYLLEFSQIYCLTMTLFIPGLGSLTKNMKVETNGSLMSTPQCAPHSSKMSCILKGLSLENESATPTLPQGAAAERQHHLQKKDVS